MRSKNPLERYFFQNKGRQIHKWLHDFEIYHRHLRRFRGKPITLIEFGVQLGGSLQMWRDYFGPRARLVGADIEPRCKQWEDSGTRIFIGDQADRRFLQKVAQKARPIDVVVEDGGHHPDQQIATFEVMYPLIKPDGVFVVEDLHTSYWSSYSGGLGRPGTFMDYAKDLTDQLNAFHSGTPCFKPTEFIKTTKSIHFYDSVVVFEKGERPVRPTHQRTGQASWNPTDHVQLKPRLSARAEMAARKVARRGRRTLRGISRATDRRR